MKEGAAIFIVLIVFGSVEASIVDQQQDEFSSGSLLVICADWQLAQTFTAGISGQLEKVDLSLDNIFSEDLYPITVSIVSVVNGVPEGSVLGQVYADSLGQGYNSINFLSESVFLFAGSQYGIVVTNSDTDRYSGTSTQWSVSDSDIYAGGSVWSYMAETGWTQSVQPPGGLPVETFYDKDAAFRTYMVPEIQGAILLGVGGLFILRKRESNRTFTS